MRTLLTLLTGDFQAVKAVGVWRNMSENLQQVWKKHVDKLNDRLQVGKVEELLEILVRMNLRTTQATLQKGSSQIYGFL